MSDRPNSQNAKLTDSESDHTDIQPQDPQPESGFIDREEQMKIRQSSPSNPRVYDKPEENQEEA